MENSINEQEPQKQPISSVPPTPNREVKLLKIAILVLFIMLAALGIYTFQLATNLQSTNKGSKEPSPTPEVIVKPSEASMQKETIASESSLTSSEEFVTYKSSEFEGILYSVSVPKNWIINDQTQRIPSAMSAVYPSDKTIFLEISPDMAVEDSSDFSDGSSLDAIKRAKKYELVTINGKKMLYTEFEDSAGYSLFSNENRRYSIEIWGTAKNPTLLTTLKTIIKSFTLLPQ